MPLIYLDHVGLFATKIDVLFTLTLVGDIIVSPWISTMADHIGRRRIYNAQLKNQTFQLTKISSCINNENHIQFHTRWCSASRKHVMSNSTCYRQSQVIIMPALTGDDSLSLPIQSMKSVRHISLDRPRPTWQEFSRFFPDERDCLAAFLALESAEVLERTKPANLVNIVNRRRPCGRNLYRLWKDHGADLVREGNLAVKELADRGDSILLLLYHSGDLTSLLARGNVSVILQKAGYQEPENLENSLVELQSRVTGTVFPHEIGIFLGYPLKDVVGFMGLAKLPFTCQGPWKMYGDPEDSIKLAAIHLRSRKRMACLLRRHSDPLICLRAGTEEAAAYGDIFFRNN